MRQIEEKYFGRPLSEIWDETRGFYLRAAPEEVSKAETNPKHKMALIFRWYFVHTMRLAVSGDISRKVDFQIHCGPALGAFNQWLEGGPLEDWRNRHVADIAERLMTATAETLNERVRELSVPETAARAAGG